ncbi:MAG: YeeE/YedE family protein [Planctomycetes bacterium]|nr:YeeE/YedE family protein [Planctomycetota bacterium]
MTNPLTMQAWSPYVVGVGVGVLSWFTFATADNPLGVSTAFETSAALGLEEAVPQAEQTNEYFAKKAVEGKPPKIGWEWMLVLGLFGGAFLSSRMSGDRRTESVPALWRERFGGSVMLRLTAAFFAGLLMMFGARLASGCTSGHGISCTARV